MLEWFQHKTFDIGLTDAEYVKSFERFLQRKGVRMNYAPSYDNSTFDDNGGYVAMGGEDRWRWRGAKKANGGDGEDNRTEPPCRCDGCKKSGVVRIIH